MIVHTLPFLLRDQHDLDMAEACFGSLQNTGNICVVLFNQGYMNNTELKKYLKKYRISFHVLGSGQNEGIPAARKACMDYIWANMPEARYISEIHVDMIFPENWHKPLIKYLETIDEPMVCPGIFTQFGEIHPLAKNVKSLEVPVGLEKIIDLCDELREDREIEGFVHPVVHRAEALKCIGGYDTRFLSGKQGFEDDSILLGYRYYMGTRIDWKPKSCLASYVYHASLAQRTTLQNTAEEFNINLNGLFRQYGAYGFMQLARIHGNNDFMQLFNSVVTG